MSPAQFEALRHHHLLATLDERQFAAIGAQSQLLVLDAGQMLFQRGSPARTFYIVLEGQVKLCLQSRNGDEKIIALLHSGQAFAEALMFADNPAYPVSAVAVVRSELAAVPNAAYKALLSASTATCFRLLADLSLRLHTHVREIEALAFENARNRVVNHLRALCEATGTDAAIELAETKQALASRLGITPETFSRMLRALADEGIIAVDGRRIRVLDAARLRPPGL